MTDLKSRGLDELLASREFSTSLEVLQAGGESAGFLELRV